MKTRLFLLLLPLFFISCREEPRYRIHILGDSTTERQNQNLKDQRGWPQMLPHFFTENVTVLNHGKSGTSSRTFYEGPWWQNARKSIQPGDYVVIQFAHNDEKHQGFDGETGTVASGSYREYLQKFVNEIRELEAIPVFATPIVRKMWDSQGRINRRGRHDLAAHIHAEVDPAVDPSDTVTFNYPLNMRQTAAANECPLIDLTASTAALVERLGNDVATRRIYNFGDATHICAEGAALFSQLFVRELKEKGILNECIIENPEIILQPGTVDFGQVTRGAEYRQEIDLVKLAEQPGFTGFRVKAGEGVLVSDLEFGEYLPEIELPARFDALYYRRLYVRIVPGEEGSFASRVTVDDGTRSYEIPVKAVAHAYAEGERALVAYSLNGNPKPEATGAVQPIEHTLSGLERSSFNMLGATGIGSRLDPPLTGRAEWLTVPGGWPAGEMDVVFNRYAQFGIKAVPGTRFQLDRITLFAGGGVRYRIQLSTDASFADYTVMGEGGDLYMTKYTLPSDFSLNGSETLYLRVYPWSSGDPAAQLCLSQVLFEGRVFSEE